MDQKYEDLILEEEVISKYMGTLDIAVEGETQHDGKLTFEEHVIERHSSTLTTTTVSKLLFNACTGVLGFPSLSAYTLIAYLLPRLSICLPKKYYSNTQNVYQGKKFTFYAYINYP